MSELLDLAGIGLPGWFVIMAAIVFIMERVGLFNFAWKHIRDRREFEQQQREAENAARQSEQVVLWSQMTALQTKQADQLEFLLEYVVGKSDDWHEKHDQRLREMQRETVEMWRQTQEEIRLVTTKLSIMASGQKKD